MADIIQRANSAYEERDKAHNQIQTMKIQAKKEASEFQHQIKDMSHLMEKLKLSSYAKKAAKFNESATGQAFYSTQPIVSEIKSTK